MDRQELRDDQWAIIEPFVPGAPLKKEAKHPKVWAAPMAGLAQNPMP